MRTMLFPSLSRRALSNVLAGGVAMSFTFGAAMVTSVIAAPPASAHGALVKITPYADALLTTAPTAVVLEFDEPVSTNFATVVVTTVEGLDVTQGKATVLGTNVTQALRPDLTSGDYRIAYRMVSDDGHPVTGESNFTLKLAENPSPSTTAGTATGTLSTAAASPSREGPSVSAAEAPSREGPQVDPNGSLSQWLLPLAGVVGLLIIGTGVLLWRRQQR